MAREQEKSDGTESLRKVKAHTTAADIGVKISDIDRIGNDLADAIAKDALSRFPDDPTASERFVKNEAVTAWAKWIGILGTLDVEDDCGAVTAEAASIRAARCEAKARQQNPPTCPGLG